MTKPAPQNEQELLHFLFDTMNEFYGRDVEEMPEPPAAAINALDELGTDAASASLVTAARSGAPWEDLEGVSETKLLYAIQPDTNAKMEWVMKHVPGMRSKQLIVRNAVQAYLDGLIAAHYNKQ